jgi:hypothetical protein
VEFIRQWLYSPLSDPGRFVKFRIHIHSRYDSLDGGSTRRKAATYTQSQDKQNKRTQTFMPRVGFEPTDPVLVREKTVHASDRAAS